MDSTLVVAAKQRRSATFRHLVCRSMTDLDQGGSAQVPPRLARKRSWAIALAVVVAGTGGGARTQGVGTVGETFFGERFVPATNQSPRIAEFSIPSNPTWEECRRGIANGFLGPQIV